MWKLQIQFHKHCSINYFPSQLLTHFISINFFNRSFKMCHTWLLFIATILLIFLSNPLSFSMLCLFPPLSRIPFPFMSSLSHPLLQLGYVNLLNQREAVIIWTDRFMWAWSQGTCFTGCSWVGRWWPWVGFSRTCTAWRAVPGLNIFFWDKV